MGGFPGLRRSRLKRSTGAFPDRLKPHPAHHCNRLCRRI